MYEDITSPRTFTLNFNTQYIIAIFFYLQRRLHVQSESKPNMTSQVISSNLGLLFEFMKLYVLFLCPVCNLFHTSLLLLNFNSIICAISFISLVKIDGALVLNTAKLFQLGHLPVPVVLV